MDAMDAKNVFGIACIIFGAALFVCAIVGTLITNAKKQIIAEIRKSEIVK